MIRRIELLTRGNVFPLSVLINNKKLLNRLIDENHAKRIQPTIKENQRAGK
jgi:hypothetical protein